MQSQPQILHIDSRHRRHDSYVAQASFDLIRPVRNVRKAIVQSIQFVNNLHNITTDNNTLQTSSGTVIIAPLYYNGVNFVLQLNTQLVSVFGAGTYVTFNSLTNEIDWTLGVNTIDGVTSAMKDVLGLSWDAALTGSFTTMLSLALPQYISFSCSQLRSSQNIYVGDSEAKDSQQPFVVLPISSGYLEAQTWVPTYPVEILLSSGQNGTTISKLDFTITDPGSGRVINEMTSWAMVLICN